MNRPCPVCGSQEKTLIFRQKFSQLSGQLQLTGYDVVCCVKCGAGFADRIPSQDWFDNYYREISKYTNDQRDGAEAPMDTARFRDIAEMIQRHLPDKQARILDVGCAVGGLLRRLKESGYENLLGMEHSAASAQIAEKINGIRVVNLSLPKLARQQPPFDLLIQVGVLEHISDVSNAINEMRQVLAPNALVYLEVPDVCGFSEWPGAPFQQFSIEHINFFGQESLNGLMARHGFETVEILRTARFHTTNAKMPVVCGFFRLTSSPQTEAPRDQETEIALQRYVKQSENAENELKRKIDQLADSKEPLVVWGVGTHTLHLLETTRFDQLNIKAFVDSNTHYQTRELLGVPVLSPAELRTIPHPILISSQIFQSEIMEQIQDRLQLPNSVITLYDFES